MVSYQMSTHTPCTLSIFMVFQKSAQKPPRGRSPIFLKNYCSFWTNSNSRFWNGMGREGNRKEITKDSGLKVDS